MLELTEAQCAELERRVNEKLTGAFSGPSPEIQEAITKMAVTAVIVTMREYDRMKQLDQSEST